MNSSKSPSIWGKKKEAADPAGGGALPRLAIIEDDELSARLLADQACQFGFDPFVLASGAEVRRHCRTVTGGKPWDLMVLDLGLPDCDGLALLVELKRDHPGLPCVILTARDKAADAVMALRGGAADYAVKPVEPAAFFARLREMLAEGAEAGLTRGRPATGSELGFPWHSRSMVGVKAQFRQALETSMPVLVEGEPGTGRSFLARALHEGGSPPGAELVTIDCGRTGEEEFNLLIFGGEAVSSRLPEIVTHKRGLFSRSRPSTLVLLDVEQLAPMSQALLNRALEAGSGACRVVATTERSFEELSVRDQSFTDLLFLLAASRIVLPPLRLRRDDLLQLFENVLSECCVRTGRRRPQLDKKAVLWIHDHPWRGNLIELREVISRLLEAEVGPMIGQDDLIRCAEEWRAERAESVAVRDGRSLDELERVALYEALKESAGNRRRAAAKLGVSLRTIYNMIERHGFKG